MSINDLQDIPVIGYIVMLIKVILRMIGERASIIEISFFGGVAGFIVGSLGWFIIAGISSSADGVIICIISIIAALFFGVVGWILGYSGKYREN